jgi:hypothetical protein
MGVLNTTWDDDGENLFGYNWYPLAWGAEVSWNPLDQNQKRFDDSYSQAFYGTTDSAVVKGILQFEKSATILDFMDLKDSYYWSWPPVTQRPSDKLARVDAKNLIEYSGNAEKKFLEAKKSAAANAENLDFLIFAAHRMKNLGERRLEYFRGADLYKKAYQNQETDREKVNAALVKIINSLDGMRVGVRGIWEEYKRVWLMENRPYWLDKNEEKYKRLEAGIGETIEKVSAVADAYKKGGALPDNKTAGLPLPER